jgi:hypothetical protein
VKPLNGLEKLAQGSSRAIEAHDADGVGQGCKRLDDLTRSVMDHSARVSRGLTLFPRFGVCFAGRLITTRQGSGDGFHAGVPRWFRWHLPPLPKPVSTADQAAQSIASQGDDGEGGMP